MKIGVYVGSFNPVHIGHITIVNELIEKKYVDKVIIVPSMNYWNKKDLVDINDRINMLKFFEKDNIIIDSKRNKLEYTYQVLDDIKKEYENAELFLIMGSDNLEKLHLWRHVDEILKNKVIIINRNNIDVSKYIDDRFILIDDIKPVDISSTEIRSNINNKKYLEKLLDENVLDYIIKNNLYKGE